MKPSSSVGLLFHNKSPNYVGNCHLKLGHLRKAHLRSHRLFIQHFSLPALFCQICFLDIYFNVVFWTQPVGGWKGNLVLLRFCFLAATSPERKKAAMVLCACFYIERHRCPLWNHQRWRHGLKEGEITLNDDSRVSLFPYLDKGGGVRLECPTITFPNSIVVTITSY